MQTYSELLDAIKLYSDKSTDAAWAQALPDFPSFVEAKVRKRLRLGQQERTAYIPTVDVKDRYTVPPLFQSPRTVWYAGAVAEAGSEPVYQDLTYRDPALLESMRRNYGGSITDYTYLDGQIVLPARPENGGQLRIVYIEGIAPLSADNASNWLLEGYPDIYLNGCMIESLKFQKGEDMQSQKAEYRGEFETELAALASVDIYDRWTSHRGRKTRANVW